QGEQRLPGDGDRAFVPEESRQPCQGEGGPRLAQVMIALQRRLESGNVTGEETPIRPIGPAQPVAAALGAEVHLLLQGWQPGRVTCRPAWFRRGALHLRQNAFDLRYRRAFLTSRQGQGCEACRGQEKGTDKQGLP